MLVRYAGLDKNDIVNGKGFCVSFWTQYCPHRCKGCHNPETWSKDGGLLIEYNDLLQEIIEAIKSNNIIRNFSILNIFGLTGDIQVLEYSLLIEALF